MRPSSHTPPETLLQQIITDLEDGTAAAGTPLDTSPWNYTAAILALLGKGPLWCSPAFLQERDTPDPETRFWCADLLQFLRALVRTAPPPPTLGAFDGLDATLGTTGPLRFTGIRFADGPVLVAASGRDVRDLVVLQLMLLLDRVGLRNVHVCGVAECPRLFVKTYRREFCSTRCQQRDYKRRLRHRAREQRERQTRARRRTKG
jgi:hypothetical protein